MHHDMPLLIVMLVRKSGALFPKHKLGRVPFLYLGLGALQQQLTHSKHHSCTLGQARIH